MAGTQAHQVAEAVRQVDGMYHQLVVLVGPPGSGKTATLKGLESTKGWNRFSVNQQLSEALLELTPKQRKVRLPSVLRTIIADVDSGVVLLDNIEMLFHPEFDQDPLRLLQGLSRNRTVVVAWPGTGDRHHLSYAVPEHGEWKRYENPDALLVTATG
jgi:hypothetical protein